MLTLRRAYEADAEMVQVIWRNNPVGGQVSYYFPTAPFCKPGYRLYFIEWDGRPVGTISLCPEDPGGHRAMYVSDAVLDRSMRGRGLVPLALCRALDETPSSGIEFLTALYSQDNHDSQRMLRSRRFKILYETPFEVFYLPALGHAEPQETSDYPQVCELVNRFYAKHVFFHRLTPEDLARREDFTVLAERAGGRIVACVGVWRQQRIRRLMLVQPRLGIRAAMLCVSLLNRHLEVTVENGAQELVAHVLTEPAFAAGHEKAFHRLLGQIGWGRDAHCFQLAAHPLCPIAVQARRRIAFRFRSVFTVFQAAGQSANLPDARGPAYHDYSWV